MPYPVLDHYEFVRCNRDCPHAGKAERITDPWWKTTGAFLGIHVLGVVIGIILGLTMAGWV